MSFWSSQPLKINSTNIKQILPASQLLEKINRELDDSRIKLDYTVIDTFSDQIIHAALDFINENYVGSSTSKLLYSAQLLKYFLLDALLILFHPKGQQKIVGIIIGKRKKLQMEDQEFSLIDVNFLCLIKKLRNLHLAPFLIGVLTKETVTRLNVSLAYYTIGARINSPCFGKKQMYHRPIHINQLVKGGFFKSSVNQKIYTDFLKTDTPTYINGSEQLPEVVEKLDKLIINYCKTTYSVFDYKSTKEVLSNAAFHNFIFNINDPTDFISLYRLDSLNKNGEFYKNGYLFIIALKSNELQHIQQVFDAVAKYCYENSILDVLTLSDIFPNNIYNTLKFIPGTGLLNYYIYNMDMMPIENSKNGLVTI